MRFLIAFVCLCVFVGTADATVTSTAFVNGSQAVILDSSGNVVGAFSGGSSSLVSYGAPEIEMAGVLTGEATALGASTSALTSTETAISAVIAADVKAAPSCAGGGLWGFIGCEALSTITTTAVSLGVSSAFQWLFNQVTGSGNLTQTANTYCGSAVNGNSCVYYSPLSACTSLMGSTYEGPSVVTSGTAVQCWAAEYMHLGTWETGSSLVSSNIQTQSTSSVVTVGGAVTTIKGDNPSELSSPMNPQTTADMINAAWQQAASQSGYTGIPYPSTNPISASDVSTWEADNPGWTATEGDDLGIGSDNGTQGNSGSSIGSLPVSGVDSGGGVAGQDGTTATTGSTVTTGTSSSTGSGTSTGTTTGTTTGASGTSSASDTSELCTEDPTASACASLGTAPTAPALSASSVTVSLSPWSIGPTSGTCPAPLTFNIFGNQLAYDYTPLCTFVGRLAPLILALCGLASALIVVSGVKS
jgi:hypothetical protein